MKRQGNWTALKKIAEKQLNYFTAKQAVKCGFAKTTHGNYCKRKKWVREDKGLFRLTELLDKEDAYSNFSRWSLWSRNKDEQPQGIISHRSALACYELVEYNRQNPVHLTVPKEFRKRNIPEYGIILHKDSLSLSQLENHGAFITTNLFRTLQDTKEELELQGIWQSISKRAASTGNLTENELKKLGIFISKNPILNILNNNIDTQLLTEDNNKHKDAEVYYRAQDAQKIFESMERQRRWKMSPSNYGTGKSQQRGFTLVELLVVIAVISVLAGMLLPALENAMAQARTIQCTSNLKQTGTVTTFYANDNENILFTALDNEPNSYAWPAFVVSQGYLGDDTDLKTNSQANIFLCPVWPPEEYDDSSSLTSNCTAYGLNTVVYYSLDGSKKQVWSNSSSINMNKLPAPSKEAILVDSNSSFMKQWSWFGPNVQSTSCRIHLRHNYRAALLLGDMHVSTADTNNLLDDYVQPYRHYLEDGTTLIYED